MKVFKFGGASVKDASAVRNLSRILSLYPDDELLVVISAMGKTTNLLEEVVNAYIKQDQTQYESLIDNLFQFHLNITTKLFSEKHFSIHFQLEQICDHLRDRYHREASKNPGFDYDQIVSIGELISSIIVESYLTEEGHRTFWIDARKVIRTNDNYRAADIDWKQTEELFHDVVLPEFERKRIGVTQGFIGHTADGTTTTLGREGSDFTAGILAYVSNAREVTIWKDVPGMLNADPKRFKETVKLDTISYKEAIELSYFGASIIHPRTLKPLQNKGIPLCIKSFINPTVSGTMIQTSEECDHVIPTIMVKENQYHLLLSPKDFSFITHNSLVDIIKKLTSYGININLIQNSALSLSVVFDSNNEDLTLLLATFENDYHIHFEQELELLTLRHFNKDAMSQISTEKEIIFIQQTRDTVRLVANPILQKKKNKSKIFDLCESV